MHAKPTSAAGARLRARLRALAWLGACLLAASAMANPARGEPLWIDAAGRPNAGAIEALGLLRAAADEGLHPAAYDAASLTETAALLPAADGATAADPRAFDSRLTEKVLLYLRHLHAGRVAPASVGFQVASSSSEPADLSALLKFALERDRLSAAAAELHPSLPQYASLRAALRRYRDIAGDADLATPPTLPLPLRPGQTSTGLPQLHRLLTAYGDLDAGTPEPASPAPYDAVLVEAVKRFQHRHGLSSDGVIGKATLAAMQVPPSQRVRQIELAMERIRWLPKLQDRRVVAINIPMFRLWAAQPGSAGPLAMNVIVGRALDTRTPVFMAEMRQVIFRPYWNVPASILRNELLPLISRDPGYLRRNHMEIVRGGGDDATPVEASAANIALLRQGVLRLRQKPGAGNSLGLVKFVFPNETNIYLHGTPAQSLFGRDRRDLSHGCVRLEDPVALAEWVLAGRPEWNRERIVQAMTGNAPVQVSLAQPISVVLYYLTAMAAPGSGELHFATDLYGHDARLERALAAAAPAIRVRGER